jgi:hypothetical protein
MALSRFATLQQTWSQLNNLYSNLFTPLLFILPNLLDGFLFMEAHLAHIH